MKIGLVSDLHLEFRNYSEILVLQKKINSLDTDIILDAGDLHPNESIRNQFIEGINKPYFHVMGNHDYYGNSLSSYRKIITVNNKKIALCTLWTDFNKEDPMLEFYHILYMLDAKQIDGATVDQIKKIHYDDKKFIEDNKPDIVVTHHVPTNLCIHPHWKGNMSNYYFVSDLDEFILNNTNIKLWVYGHTHDHADVMVGNTRVTGHPLGYPHERNVDFYEPKIIEIED